MAGHASAHFTDFSHRDASGPRAERISKNAWMDLYADLYLQVFGSEDVPASEILDDAERRLRILRQNGIRP